MRHYKNKFMNNNKWIYRKIQQPHRWMYSSSQWLNIPLKNYWCSSKRYCNKHITLHNTKISIEYDNKRYDKRIKSINKTFANFWVIQLKKKKSPSPSLPLQSIHKQSFPSTQMKSSLLFSHKNTHPPRSLL